MTAPERPEGWQSYRLGRQTRNAAESGRSSVFVAWVRARTVEEARQAAGAILRRLAEVDEWRKP